MRAIILARVSDEDQRKALPAQMERLHSYVEKKQFELIKEYEFDETAFTTKRRKKFSAILKEVESYGKKERVALVADKVDRLLRDIPTLVRVGEMLTNDTVELHFANDNLSVDKNMSAHDDFRLGLAAILARFYSKSSSDNIKRIFSYLMKQGVLLTKAPFGYKNIVREDRSKWVIVQPDEAPALVSIFKWRLEKYEYKEISKMVKEQYGFYHPTNAIERMVHNPFYGGFIRDDKTGDLYPHKYEIIVPYELYQEVQDMGKRRFTPREGGYLFTGIIKCDYCGMPMVAYASSKYKGTDNEKRYIRCRKSDCPNQPASEPDLIDQIAEALKTFCLTDEDIEKIIAYIAQAENSGQRVHKTQLKDFDKEIERLEKQMSEIAARADKYDLPPELVKKEIDNVKAEWNSVKKKRQLEEGKETKDLALTAEKVLHTAKNAHLIFSQSSSISDRRELLNNLVEPLKMRDKKLLIGFKPLVNKFFCTENKDLVDPRGFELLTSSVQTRRSTK